MQTDNTLPGILIVERDKSGLISICQATGALPTDASKFAVGCLLVHTTLGNSYTNGGTTASPSWNNISEISSSEIADGAVTASKIANSAVAPAKQTSGTISTATVNNLYFAFIPSATVKALLDTNTNDLWEAPANSAITDVIIRNFSPAGSTGTVDIGTDASWVAGVDQNGFVEAHNANVGGGVNRMILLDTASQAAYAAGMLTTTGGSVTITSSADLTESSWDGHVLITFTYVA